MKIGIAQIDCEVGDVDANCKTIASMVRKAADADCDVVVLPEMADTGYDMETIRVRASTWDGGPCEMLRGLAADLGISVICGLSEREDDRIYNAAAVIDGAGTLVAKYRKAHLFCVPGVREDRYLSRGESLTLARLGGFRLGIMICYDLRFPEMARALVLGGAELLVVVAAWPVRRAQNWRILSAARAIENQAYLVSANRVGSDGPLLFCGTSGLLDPTGAAMVCASETEQTLLTGEVTRGLIEQTRSSMRVFEDRQERLYASLLRDSEQDDRQSPGT